MAFISGMASRRSFTTTSPWNGLPSRRKMLCLRGKPKLGVDFAYDGGGMGKGGKITMSANGSKIAEGRLERTMPIQFSLGEGLDIGRDVGSAIDFTYKLPFAFTGTIEKVTMDLNRTQSAKLLPRSASGSSLGCTTTSKESKSAQTRLSEDKSCRSEDNRATGRAESCGLADRTGAGQANHSHAGHRNRLHLRARLPLRRHRAKSLQRRRPQPRR